MQNDPENILLAKDQHKELITLIKDVTSSLKALFVVPVMILYLLGVDLALWLDRIPVLAWALMNVLAVGPFILAGFLLILRKKDAMKED